MSPQGADWSKPLPMSQGRPFLAMGDLDVASGHVEAGRVSVDVVERIGFADIRAARSDGRDQLHLVVEVARLRCG